MGMRQGTDDAEAGWRPHGEAVLCVTGDPVLLDECARVAAVAGVALRTAPTLGEAMKGVDDDVPLLLGADVRDVPPRNRPDMILVGRGNDSGLLWHRAAELGVEHVAELPEAAGWLVEFLGRRLSQGRDGLVVSLVGGCGGAGASTTAVLLAMAANARGESVLLVDGDRLGGGLELCLSNEHTSGLAWPDLAAASGRIHPPQLEAALPRVLGVPYVSWPASAGYAKPVAPEAIAGVLEAGRSAFELVVIDLGRSREGIDDFGWASDRFLLVVPGRIRAAVAATQLLHEIPPVPTGLVVRGRLGEGVDAERLAGAVGCPLAAHLPELRAANAATEEGRLPELSRRRDVRRAAGLILEGLVGSPGRSSPRAGAPMPRHARLPQAAR
ncbi:septum site-determining protein Ssd [Sinomonas susongensis]|uniref:septum site-determining protein Ssd n=1 Tax=Sinomonas susongensis TaxID=1324851 RepID=UPI00110882A1|nr:septum site-determining protein Ssd [Sinomonas susongensis]